MQTIKQLKAKYDKQTIKAIEKEAKATQGQAKDVYYNFIEILFYLERTQRFKENPLYKKSTFQQYLPFAYGIRFTTYHEARLALSNFPEFSKKYTPQLVKAIKEKCGADKVPAIIKEIEAKDTSLKKPLPREGIQAIIDKNRKPVKPQTPKPDVKILQDKVVTFQESAKKLEKVVLTKDEQITKLKATVKRLTAEIEALKRENEALTAAARPIADYFMDALGGEAVAVQ